MKRLIGAIALCISAPASAQTLADLNLPYDVPSCPAWTTQLFPPCTAAPGPDAKIFASDGSHEFLVPLSEFPTASYVDQINATVNGLTTSFTHLNDEFASVARQTKINERGVSMAFALSGIGDLASDEHVAVGFNWGTFQGQNSLAAGVAVRAADHLSFNAGFAGDLSGGNVGGRAGVRFAW
jgi:hypothetical protein